MGNKNGDFRSKTKKIDEINNHSLLNPSNELQSGPKKKLLSDNTVQNTFSGGNLNNPGKKEENLRKKILNEDSNELLGNISNNISAESKGIDKLKVDSNKNLFHTEKKKNKDLTIPIIIGIVVFIIIIGIVAQLFINEKFKQEKESSQQKILNSSMKAMSDVESYSFDGNFNLNFNDSEKEFFLAMEFTGKTDESDSNNIKNSFNIKPSVNIFNKEDSEEISFDFSTMSFGKAGEEIFYFKLNDFDLGAAGIIYGEMIVPYKNKW